jgi:hypothetical protein
VAGRLELTVQPGTVTFTGRLLVYTAQAPGRALEKLDRIADLAVILAVLPTELTYTNVTTIECTIGPAPAAS